VGPHGAELQTVTDGQEILSAVLAGQTCYGGYPAFSYALLQCDDTLVWGIAADNTWTWGHEADHELRQPRLDRVLEARLFSPDGEILLWRVQDGIYGRYLTDSNSPVDSALQPLEAHLIFEQGDDQEMPLGKTGFVRRETSGGLVTVTPAGRRIAIRQYLSESVNTGAVRITATRFVVIQ